MGDDCNDYVNTEIVCTLAALGYIEGNDYYKGDDCLECLKDLIRFLRTDDATCTVRRQLGRSKIVEKDLIPILRSCTSAEQDILEVCIRLLVNLTQPAVICFGKVPTEKMERNQFLEVMSHLQSCKEAFSEKEIMAVMGRELGRLLQLDWDDREEEDTLLIERILLLLRNILHVPADPQAEKRTDEDATVHDQVLWNLHVNGVSNLIMYIASSVDESRWCMHALEIISHMLREQKPDILAKTAVQRTRKEREEDTRQLDILYEREKADKKASSRSGIRHSNFGGTFCVQTMKALNEENELLYHRPLQSAKKLSFDFGKNPPKKRKNEILAKETDTGRRSTLSVRMFLKDFCCQFLEDCYNPLMHTIKDNLKHQRSQENDESYFLWAMRFFMEFNRQNKFEIAYISETLSVSIFQYVLVLVTKFFDNLWTDKEGRMDWSKRLHLALRAYQELIQHLVTMGISKDVNIKESAKVIKENIFYVQEYRDVFMVMLRKFNPCCQTRSFLRDLIEAFHAFIKLLEGHCKNKSHFVVQQNRRKAKKKKKSTIPRAEPIAALTPEQMEEVWQTLSADLSSFFQSDESAILTDASPFDPVSDVQEEEQKTKCLVDIQRNLRAKSFGHALALLRAAREVWPNSSFGENDVDTEGEFMCLYEIFRMDLPAVAIEVEPEANNEQEDEMTDPEEEEIQSVQTSESEFEIKDFLKKLASPLILQPYCWLLNWYQENNAQTNHYIIKMLHRVAVDLKMPAMLFQLSLFVTFRKILYDPAARNYKELVTFSKYILSKFFALLPNNPALCAELIFWKSATDCYEITEGYGSLAQREVRQSGHSWTFEEEEELKTLYEEFKDTEDLVENILNGITNEFRTRRQVVGKLITLRLVQDKSVLKKNTVNRNAWTEDEENELRTLFEEHKESEDIVNDILQGLSNQSRSRRQVVGKLIALDLVQDKSILKKKTVSKNAWTEDEENELRTLFEEHKESEDIVDSILQGLSNQIRSRRQVVNQLVKLNIVEDRKILRKKRPKKSKGRKRNEYEEDGDQDEEDSEANLEDRSAEEMDEGSENDNDDGEEQLSTLMRELGNSEHAEQLNWIKTRLTTAAEDREEDGEWEALPLVTLTEESELALRDKCFQKVLKKIGLAPPANEQERFWRIPENMSPGQLRKAVSDLEAVPAYQETNPAATENEMAKSNPKKQKLAQLVAARKSSNKRGDRARKRKDRSRESTNKDQRDKAKQWRTNVGNDESSDSDGSENEEVGERRVDQEMPGEKQKADKRPRRKRVRMAESDDEDEDAQLSQMMGNEKASEVRSNNLEQNENMEEEDDASDDNYGKTGRKTGRDVDVKESDSSDEDGFDMPLIRTKKLRHTVLDDDDDEDDLA